LVQKIFCFFIDEEIKLLSQKDKASRSSVIIADDSIEKSKTTVKQWKTNG
jgi:hypothetical protein